MQQAAPHCFRPFRAFVEFLSHFSVCACDKSCWNSRGFRDIAQKWHHHGICQESRLHGNARMQKNCAHQTRPQCLQKLRVSQWAFISVTQTHALFQANVCIPTRLGHIYRHVRIYPWYRGDRLVYALRGRERAPTYNVIHTYVFTHTLAAFFTSCRYLSMYIMRGHTQLCRIRYIYI